MDSQRPQAFDISRTLPADNGSEQAILCSIFLKPKWAMEQCLDKLKSEHFSNPAHRALYETMLGQHNAGEPIGILELTPILQQQKKLDTVGGYAYLAELQSLLPTASNLPYYSEVVRDQYHRRQLLLASREFEESVYADPEELASSVGGFEKAIECWKEQKVAEESNPADRGKLMAYLERLETRAEKTRNNQIEGVPTGILTLDRTIGGLKKKRLYIIGGRPWNCKSILAGQVCAHAIFTPKANGKYHKGIFFSAEMNEDECYDRILANLETASGTAIATGLLNENFFIRIGEKAGHLRDHLFIQEAHDLTVSQIAQQTRRAMMDHPDLDFIAIDYLQCLRHECGPRSSPTEQVSQIARDLNKLKVALNMPLLVCASMNRGPETRKDSEPRLSDLRQSGQIESDADCIMLMWMEEKDEEGVDRKGKILVRKNRGGGGGCRDIDVYLERRSIRLMEPRKSF